MGLDQELQTTRERLARIGQEHVLRFWGDLNAAERANLLDDIRLVDLETCAQLAKEAAKPPVKSAPTALEPPEVMPAEPAADQRAMYAEARARGEEAIRSGRVAAFTVAGGQGTRLGFEGPKGCFPISPVRKATLFQLFAEFLQGVRRRYGRLPAWYIMTSPSNHQATRSFFEEHKYFGLPPEQVEFFNQGQMPAFLPDGRLAMSSRHRLSLAPDGHGGSLAALRVSGALDRMRSRGAEVLSYFQVDNPLVKPIDPLFIGLHLTTGSQMSSKAVRKADDRERVGIFARRDGRLTVVEYSDLPDELATARDASGERRFDAGSIAVHLIDRDFIAGLTDPAAQVRLPWHRAEKRQEVVNSGGETEAATVIKFEKFVFDAIAFARSPLVLYTHRAEEFSPVKNAEGVDSPETARRDLVRRAARWLEGCGVTVPRAPAEASSESQPAGQSPGLGEPAVVVEISPAFALDAEDLKNQIEPGLRLVAGERRVLE